VIHAYRILYLVESSLKLPENDCPLPPISIQASESSWEKKVFESFAIFR
jgi:hypothetical protein